MKQVYLLTEGYAIYKDDFWQASSSAVLVDVDGYKILIDPGANEKALVDSLKQLSICADEIDMIFLTHKHLDHLALLSMFTNVPICDGSTLLQGDNMTICSKYVPQTDIEIIHTPGHCHEHYSLLVQTPQKAVAIAGDLFWWQAKQKPEDMINAEDPLAVDTELMIINRKTICERAEVIIPGHGKPFLTSDFSEFIVDKGGIL